MHEGLAGFVEKHVTYFDESDQLSGVELDLASGEAVDWFAFHEEAEQLSSRP